MGGDNSKQEKLWNLDEKANDEETDFNQKVKLLDQFNHLVQLYRRGHQDLSLLFKMHQSGLTDNEIVGLWENLSYSLLLYRFGRISGLVSYDKLVGYFVGMVLNPLEIQFQLEVNNFIFGGLFPLPINYDQDDWKQYQLTTYTEYVKLKHFAHPWIEKAIAVFFGYYGIVESQERLVIQNREQFQSVYEKDEHFSRFLRVLFCVGVWGMTKLFLKLKFFTSWLFTERRWKNQKDKQFFFKCLMNTMLIKEKSLANEISFAEIRSVFSKNVYKKGFYSEDKFTLTFDVNGTPETFSIFEEITSKLQKYKPKTKGDWYLFNTDTGSLYPIEATNSYFLIEPQCWKNCSTSNDLKNNFSFFLSQNEISYAFPLDYIGKTDKYKFLYLSDLELPNANVLQKPKKKASNSQEIFQNDIVPSFLSTPKKDTALRVDKFKISQMSKTYPTNQLPNKYTMMQDKMEEPLADIVPQNETPKEIVIHQAPVEIPQAPVGVIQAPVEAVPIEMPTEVTPIPFADQQMIIPDKKEEPSVNIETVTPIPDEEYIIPPPPAPFESSTFEIPPPPAPFETRDITPVQRTESFDLNKSIESGRSNLKKASEREYVQKPLKPSEASPRQKTLAEIIRRPQLKPTPKIEPKTMAKPQYAGRSDVERALIKRLAQVKFANSDEMDAEITDSLSKEWE